MSIKASAPISNQQDIFARKLVEEGRYASLSAAVQRDWSWSDRKQNSKRRSLRFSKICLITVDKAVL